MHTILPLIYPPTMPVSVLRMKNYNAALKKDLFIEFRRQI